MSDAINFDLPRVSTGANLYDVADPTAWGAEEVTRLQGMDELLSAVTRARLIPLLGLVASEARLLDIGGGTGRTVEGLCDEAGVEYHVLDVNAEILAARSTPSERTILGRAEDIPEPDGAFDVTFSRAVTAWNPDPMRAIAEQLRVTKPGGFAVFMEFDWAKAGMAWASDAMAAGQAAKRAMMMALEAGGFKTGYGAELGSDIDAAANASDVVIDRQEQVLDFPEGDYRRIFLDAARGIVAHLKSVGVGPAATAAMFIESNAREIDDPRNAIVMRLPAIVTQTVQRQ